MDEQLKSNLTSSKHWLRLVFMLLFAILLQVALAVMWVLVAIQFLFALVTGKDNLNLRQFGDSLGQFIFQTIQFLTYNSEEKPFPFADWPEASPLPEPEPEASVEPVAEAEKTPQESAESSESEAAGQHESKKSD